ncbi:MAG: hypothetical protein GYA31_00765 [Parcubacteria group bacterium]|nr:hypothetical protein [Parcubacteria group bacterium]
MNKPEAFVQAIPYGRSLRTVKMKVDTKGEVVIIGKEKTWRVKDIDAAIRQQLFHVIFHYEDFIMFSPIKNQYPGKISKLRNTLDKINSMIKTTGDIKIVSLASQFDKLKEQLNSVAASITAQEVKSKEIVAGVLWRAQKLIEEKQRCVRLIMYCFETLCSLYNTLESKDTKKIKWNVVFDSLKKIQTVHVNPYRERTRSREIKFLQYNLFPLVETNLDTAKTKIQQAIFKLIPIYPLDIEFKLGDKTYRIKNGQISG